jgi:hypothetical protein
VANPIHDHHVCVKRGSHDRVMDSPDDAPEVQILGRSRRDLHAEAEARLAAFVVWLRDQVTGEGTSGPNSPER